MEKLTYDQSQKPFLIKAFKAQIEDLKKQLSDLYLLLAQVDSSLVNSEFSDLNLTDVPKFEITKRVYSQRDGSKDYFNKVKEILEKYEEPLTSREILRYLYDIYPREFDKNNDRKNIASLSAILTEKITEKKIQKQKPPVGHPRYYLPSRITEEQSENNSDIEDMRRILEKN